VTGIITDTGFFLIAFDFQGLFLLQQECVKTNPHQKYSDEPSVMLFDLIQYPHSLIH
jgi:hypothetical protein